jgi:hypothetical protein
MKTLSLIVLAFGAFALSSPCLEARVPMLLGEDRVTTCFPETDLRFPIGRKTTTGLNLFDLLAVVKDFETIMGPEVRKNFGKKLIIEHDWDNDRVNAHATRDSQNNPIIRINGGLARHPEMTRDALSAILCHELGHQFGGAPKQRRGQTDLRSWSSAEGQADYYATTKCLPILFSQGESSRKVTTIVDNKTQLHLQQVCDDETCQRAALAALQMARVFASLRLGIPEPTLVSTDPTQVYETNLGHPQPQCRLDTMIAGLFCLRAREKHFDDEDALAGACMDEPGGRPACWFHPDYY